MKIPVTTFKAHCTELLRNLAVSQETIEVTSKGKVVAVILPPPPASASNPLVGCLQGTVDYLQGWDEPLGDEDWEASR